MAAVKGGPVDGKPMPTEPGVLCTYTWPSECSNPGLLKTINGADWIIDGHRYRETGREATVDGDRLTLVRADADPDLGYATLEET